MAGVFEIREGLVSDHTHHRYGHMQGDGGHWGVWNFDAKEWRREPSYTQREAATMARFLNRNPKVSP